MKRIMSLLLFLVFVLGLLFVTDDAAFAAQRKKKDNAEAAKVEQSAAIAPAAKEGKLVCAFKDKEKMTEFEKFYISKQATFGRMGVLQAYFAMEQSNLAEIDRQMEEKFGFKMDPNKMYDLNRDTMEIRDLGPVAAPAPAE